MSRLASRMQQCADELHQRCENQPSSSSSPTSSSSRKVNSAKAAERMFSASRTSADDDDVETDIDKVKNNILFHFESDDEGHKADIDSDGNDDDHGDDDVNDVQTPTLSMHENKQKDKVSNAHIFTDDGHNQSSSSSSRVSISFLIYIFLISMMLIVIGVPLLSSLREEKRLVFVSRTSWTLTIRDFIHNVILHYWQQVLRG